MAAAVRWMQFLALVLQAPTLAFAEIVIMVEFITAEMSVKFIVMFVIALFLRLASRRRNINPLLYRIRVYRPLPRSFR